MRSQGFAELGDGDLQQHWAPDLVVAPGQQVLFENPGEVLALRQELGGWEFEGVGDVGDVVRGRVLDFEEVDEVGVEIGHGLVTEDESGGGVVVEWLLVEVHGEEDHNLVALEILFCTVELLVVFEEPGTELTPNGTIAPF